MNTRSSRSKKSAPVQAPWTLETLLDGAIETIILAILVITPWLFGGAQPYHIHLACCGLGLILALWSLKQIIRWRLDIYRCSVSIVLAVLFLVSCLGLVPMSRTALQWLGPEVVRQYEALLPKAEEVPAFNQAEEPLPFAPGTTLSLYPSATQTRLVELLAAIVLFVVVRHGLASPERFKRLAWVLVLNGCVLSVFALIQKVRAPVYTIYGIEVPGDSFGPFINRNHFASYVNFCICLGMGLFLAVMQRRSGAYEIDGTGQKAPLSYSTNAWSEILQHPQAVWLLVPLSVCITAVLASLSRGGILALTVGLGMAGILWRKKGNTQTLVALLLIPLLALGLLLWYGADPTLQRLEQEQFSQEGRFAIWRASWDVFCRFPMMGTGLGTFPLAEPLFRPEGANQTITHEHAHNEYMEALVEGGIVRFVLTLALIWLVLRRGWQTIKTRQRSTGQAMALGGWAACITLAVQSFGEFGVHMPSVTAVLAVTAGYLVALGGQRRSESGEDPLLIRWNYFGVGPILGTSFALTLGVILFAGSWLNWQGEDFRLFGLKLRQTSRGDAARLQQAVEALDIAIHYAPAHARLRMERVEVENQRLLSIELHERDAYQSSLSVQQLARLTATIAQNPMQVLSLFAEDAIEPFQAQTAMSRQLLSRQLESWKKQQRHIRAARDLCPLAWRPHLEIAEHVAPTKAVIAAQDRLLYWKQSDPIDSYLKRIKQLHPHRAETWFLCGHLEGINGLREQAIQSWRRCLELSDEFLEPIIQESSIAVLQPELKLTPAEIITRLLPAEGAAELVKSSRVLFPDVKQVEERRPFVEKAIQILESRKDILSPVNQFNYGLALWGINKPEQALQHLLVATKAQPTNALWRIDLARLYFELEKYADAREQAGIVLRALPNNVEVLELLQKLDALQRTHR